MAKGGVEVVTRGESMAAIAKRLESAQQVIKAGWLETAQPYPDGTDVKLVAAAQEFGTTTIPARAPLRTYFDGPGGKALSAEAAGALRKIMDGGSPAAMGADLGKMAVEGVAETIKRGLPPPLSDLTTAAPGRNPGGVALMDTGHLVGQLDSSAEKT